MDKQELKIKTRLRREYGGLAIEPLGVEMTGPVLASSVMKSASIQSVGQEVGVIYDLSVTDGIDTNTGKTFAHEWEESSGL